MGWLARERPHPSGAGAHASCCCQPANPHSQNCPPLSTQNAPNICWGLLSICVNHCGAGGGATGRERIGLIWSCLCAGALCAILEALYLLCELPQSNVSRVLDWRLPDLMNAFAENLSGLVTAQLPAGRVLSPKQACVLGVSQHNTHLCHLGSCNTPSPANPRMRQKHCAHSQRNSPCLQQAAHTLHQHVPQCLEAGLLTHTPHDDRNSHRHQAACASGHQRHVPLAPKAGLLACTLVERRLQERNNSNQQQQQGPAAAATPMCEPGCRGGKRQSSTHHSNTASLVEQPNPTPDATPHRHSP